jgi:hypothetical protein
MMMCLSNSQDYDSMMIVSMEKHGISRVERARVRYIEASKKVALSGLGRHWHENRR